MSLQINFQKTNKTSCYKDRMVVRRFAYDKEAQKTKAGKVIFSCHVVRMPDEIPDDKIQQHSVTKEEQLQYIETVKKIREEENKQRLDDTLPMLCLSMSRAISTLEGITSGIEIADIEKTEELVKKLKQELARHKKNAKKRK